MMMGLKETDIAHEPIPPYAKNAPGDFKDWMAEPTFAGRSRSGDVPARF
jgi:hypothetical protein